MEGEGQGPLGGLESAAWPGVRSSRADGAGGCQGPLSFCVGWVLSVRDGMPPGRCWPLHLH